MRLMLCSAGLSALALALVSSPAQAQEVAPPTVGTVAAPDEADAPIAGDIVVTARRRAEALSTVPVSVAAVAGDALAQRGIERVDDLVRAVPSLSARPNTGRRSNSQYEIRGISASDSLITGDPTVGVYINEVYRSRAAGTNQSFYDIENVQVLYGPQGTLFGRNATGGAVLIATRKPTFDFGGEVEVGYGNYDHFELTGIVNIPLSDTLAVRLAGQRNRRDGYGVNVTTGRRLANNNVYSGRASILWQPTAAIENLTVGSLFKANERGSLIKLIGFRPCPVAGVFPRPAASCSTGTAVFGTPAPPTLGTALANFANNVNPTLGTYETALNATVRDFTGIDQVTGTARLSPDPLERARNRSISNTTSIELTDELTLKNIIAYNYTKLIAASDFDATPLQLIDTYLFTNNKTFTEELQLQGDMGRFNWVVGALYFRERGRDIQPSIQNVGGDSRSLLIGTNKSYAAFAQGTYELVDDLSLTAGARYTRDERKAEYINPRTFNRTTNTSTCTFNAFPAAVNPDTDGDCNVVDTASFNQPTYTVSVDYKPRPGMLVYVAHRYGYRSGGLQARVFATASGPVPAFRPETVKDIEFGFKGTFELGGDAVLRTNLAAYKSWYDGLQRSVTLLSNLPPPNSATTTAIFNSGKADVKGFEADATLTLNSAISLSGYVGHVDGIYKDFPSVDPTISPTAPGGPRPVLVDVAFGAARWTAGATSTITPVDNDETGTINWTTSFSYKSSFTAENPLPFLEPESGAPAQYNVNTSVNWENIMGSRVSAQAWVRNLFDRTQILGVGGFARSFGIATAVLGEPRMYGVSLKFEFGN